MRAIIALFRPKIATMSQHVAENKNISFYFFSNKMLFTMKGIYFKTPLEFRLVTDGESWSQGGKITGTLEIKNQGSTDASLDSVSLALVLGSLKKVAAKKEDSFQVLNALD